MPELPEVETIRRDLVRMIKDLTIRDIRFFDTRVIRDISPQIFRKNLIGRRVTHIERHGKALVFRLSPGRALLVVQLMMTGQLVLQRELSKDRATKVVFVLSNGQYLLYNDHRVFGRLQIVEDLKAVKYFQILGPEPLARGFTSEILSARLHGRKRPIKNVLLDHTVLAGIGNIYAAEILFAARIHPQRSAIDLAAGEIRWLHRAIKEVLHKAVASRGTSMNTYRDADGQKGKFMNYIRVYGREEEPCPRCRKPIRRITQAGRSTFFCEHCQK
jgi:formamidopyrimidine-DNA glycosylase